MVKSSNQGIIELLRPIFRQWVFISCFIIVAVGLTFIYSLTVPEEFKATTTFLPLASISSGTSGGFSVGSAADEGGGALGAMATMLGVEKSDRTEQYLHILKSRTLAENVIRRLNLMPYLFSGVWDQENKRWKEPRPHIQEGVRRFFKKLLSITDTKKKLVKVSVVSRDPDLSAQVANAVITELENFLNDSALSVGKKRRIFIEKQLIANTRELAKAEEDFLAFQKANGLLDAEASILATEQMMGSIKQELLRNEVERGVAKKTLAPSSVELQIRQTRIDVLRRKLQEIEKGTLTSIKEKGTSVAQVSELAMRFQRLKRALLIGAQINTLLMQQYELAKIDEVREDFSIQVIDKAVPPYRRFRPNIRLNLLAAFLASFFLAIFVAFFHSQGWGGGVFSHRSS